MSQTSETIQPSAADAVDPAKSSSRRIKAVCMWQPWATLAARGIKTLETRSWRLSHRGLLAVFATLSAAPEGLLATCSREPFTSLLASINIDDTDQLPQGAIVGVVWHEACYDVRHDGLYLHEADERAPVQPDEVQKQLGNYDGPWMGIGYKQRYVWHWPCCCPLETPIKMTAGGRTMFDVNMTDQLQEAARAVTQDHRKYMMQECHRRGARSW